MTNHLLRDRAPISDAAWQAIESDVKPRLRAHLAARQLVDFAGPLGWDHAATSLGRAQPVADPVSGVHAARREVLPLVELSAGFSLPRRVLDDVDRGSRDPDLSALDAAAVQLALAESRAVFHGYAAGEIHGLTEASSHEPVPLDADVKRYAAVVAGAVDRLRQSGIGGPYGLAIAPGLYTEIIESTEHGGYPLFDHVREILGGPIVWAPGVECGVVVSQRGGDFAFECGEDISIGYSGHDAESVQLYLEESFTFRVLEPDAVVALQAAK